MKQSYHTITASYFITSEYSKIKKKTIIFCEKERFVSWCEKQTRTHISHTYIRVYLKYGTTS